VTGVGFVAFVPKLQIYSLERLLHIDVSEGDVSHFGIGDRPNY